MRRLGGRYPGLVVFALALSTLLYALVAPHPQAQEPTWSGTVKVTEGSSGMEQDRIMLAIGPGESVTYSVKLDRKPTINGVDIPNDKDWFVMMHINGVKYRDGLYKDLTVIPSFYRTFDNGDWYQWKNFRITRMSDEEWESSMGAVPAPRRSQSNMRCGITIAIARSTK